MMGLGVDDARAAARAVGRLKNATWDLSALIALVLPGDVASWHAVEAAKSERAAPKPIRNIGRTLIIMSLAKDHVEAMSKVERGVVSGHKLPRRTVLHLRCHAKESTNRHWSVFALSHARTPTTPNEQICRPIGTVRGNCATSQQSPDMRDSVTLV
jgi:hypothetical protein